MCFVEDIGCVIAPLTVCLDGGGCDVLAEKQQYWARRVQAPGTSTGRVHVTYRTEFGERHG